MTEKLLWDEVAGIADSDPERIALLSDDGAISYGELAERAAERAARLRAAGMRTGDRVVLRLRQQPRLHHLGIRRLAGGVHPGHRLPAVGPGRARVRRCATPSPPVCSPTSPERQLSPARLQAAACRSTSTPSMTSGDVVSLPSADEWFLPSIDPEAVALICYTSGTTANPKPVAHSHLGLTRASRTYAKVWRMSSEDRTLVCLPMAWIYGLVSASLVTLVAGGAVVAAATLSSCRGRRRDRAPSGHVLPGCDHDVREARLLPALERASPRFELDAAERLRRRGAQRDGIR